MNKGRDRGNWYSFLTLTGPAEAAEVNARVQVLEEEERNTVLAAPQEAALHRIIYQKKSFVGGKIDVFGSQLLNR